MKTQPLSLFRSLVASWLLLLSIVANAEPIWIDVRSAAEHQADHIPGDLRITHSEITTALPQLFPDRDTEIRLYCRSGRRADVAIQALQEAGYRNVSNAGSIESARQERGLVP